MKEVWGEARCSSNDLLTWKDQKLSLKIKETETISISTTGGNLNLFPTEVPPSFSLGHLPLSLEKNRTTITHLFRARALSLSCRIWLRIGPAFLQITPNVPRPRFPLKGSSSITAPQTPKTRSSRSGRFDSSLLLTLQTRTRSFIHSFSSIVHERKCL